MSSRCNIIDNDGNFSSRDAFEAALPCKGSTLRDGINYWIVAVFGGQSTGKSTLLNGIFGTNFETMNEEHGRSQTTRGIWLEESPRCRSLYAMDVEGTDGQERFDCQTFERRTSLFALAVCDVFVINMWTAEVGRFNAANLSLLRTIFEMRLDLFPSFKKGEKTCILFVLRDHVSGTLEKHAEVMRNSLQKVWDNVTQAHVEKSRQLNDVFSLHFMSLPHYHLQRDAFDAGVVQLSKLLTPTDPSTSILPLESAKEGVPLSELHTYMSNVWNTIYLNKDLDIPSQKELLARHRCTEISEVWWKQSAEKIDSWRYTVCEERRVIPEIGVLVEELARDATTHLEEEAKLYSPVIVQRSARELQDKIVQACKVVVEEQIQIVVHHHKETFMHRTQSAMDAALLKGNSVPMCWEEIRRETARYSEEIEEIIQERVKERVLDNYTHERAVGILKEVVTESVSNRLRTTAQDLHKRMHDAFENDLHHIKDGSNRFFHSVTLLTTTAKRSQGVGFEYLDAVCVNRLEFPELDQSVRLVRNGSLINYTDSMKASSFLERHPQLFIVGLAECQRAHELYLQQVEFTIQLLERNIEMGANRIPWYFWLLLVYFARNDLWYILTSPMILITLGVVLYVFLSAQIKEWILRTLSDPPIWFQYMELRLEQHAPHLSTWIREKRGQVAVMNAPSS